MMPTVSSSTRNHHFHFDLMEMKILYGAMSDSAKRLTVREFLHCYHPDEIDRSRGIYSFVPRSPLLKVVRVPLFRILRPKDPEPK